MKKSLFLLFTIFIYCIEPIHASLPEERTHFPIEQITLKIWNNECHGTIEGLTTWNKGEEFPSFGIGHFIWYPVGQKGPFKEVFSELIQFLIHEKASIPSWIKTASGSPWASREQFLAEQQSNKMQELRQFLFQTRHEQTRFIIQRLTNSLPTILKGLSEAEKNHVQRQFESLKQSPKGVFALIDYVNFKGEGVSQTEQYRGKGWGLKQVLLEMKVSANPIEAFISSAKHVLSERVANSPQERNEGRWLQGWLNRIDSYTSNRSGDIGTSQMYF